MPPSIKILEERLNSRSTDSPESIARRVEKAEKEIKTADFNPYLSKSKKSVFVFHSALLYQNSMRIQIKQLNTKLNQFR